MSKSVEYVTLISGLPSPDRLFFAKLPPISRLKLEQRLRQLTPEHRKMLSDIEQVLDWRMLRTDMMDEQFLNQVKAVYRTLDSDTLKELLIDKLEMRTFVAALRLRRKGQGAPTTKHWGYGRWTGHISKNWNDPHFGLEAIFPWIIKAQSLISSEKSEELERFIVDQAFKKLQRIGGQHYFDFEAVVIYVLKWNIIDRATRYNVEGSRRRFTDLVEMEMRDFASELLEESI